MSRKLCMLLSLVLSVFFVSMIWQYAEPDIHSVSENLFGRIFGRAINQTQVLDKQGIPMQIYPDGSKRYNHLFIAKEAQEEFWLRKTEPHAQRFILLTDWLLQHLTVTDSTCYMEYQFDFPKFELQKPWSSALTQAVGMNALAMRAGYDKDINKYILANKMLHTLTPEAGQVTHAFEDSSLWFMEYPGKMEYFALSGMMSTLIELHKYYELTGNQLAQELFERGYRRLLILLPKFDYNGFSYYNLRGDKAGRSYHQRHSRRLKELNGIKADSLLMYYSERWRKSDTTPVIWHMIQNPRILRIIAFLLPCLLLWGFIFYLINGMQKTQQSDLEHN